MAKQIEIWSKDENLLVIVDSDYTVLETHAYIPAMDSMVEMTNTKLTERAEELVQKYIEENDIKLENPYDCDDFGSQSYRRFVSNF